MSNMVVRTNIYALNSHRNMKNVGLQQKQASNRLSSGYRVNSAADDAAGLAISETMRAQIRGLDQASRNAQDGQAMILTTEGGLEEIGNMLQRTRELLVQAANDTNTQTQRDMIQQEIQQLGQEIQGMQVRVEFNTNRVLDMGIPSNIAGAQATFAAAKGTLSTAMGNVSNKLVAAEAKAGSAAAATGAATTGVLAGSAAVLRGSAAAMTSNARTTFNGAEAVYRAAIMSGTSTGSFTAWFQVGANSGQSITFDFATVHEKVTLAGRLVSHLGEVVALPGSQGQSGIGFGKDVTKLIDDVQTAIDGINSTRANLGAVQNRMDYTMRSLDISSENLSDSESRVRNADMAKEMMKFTMSNVLQQAAVSMLSQANQMPNNLLQLLR